MKKHLSECWEKEKNPDWLSVLKRNRTFVHLSLCHWQKPKKIHLAIAFRSYIFPRFYTMGIYHLYLFVVLLFFVISLALLYCNLISSSNWLIYNWIILLIIIIIIITIIIIEKLIENPCIHCIRQLNRLLRYKST